MFINFVKGASIDLRSPMSAARCDVIAKTPVSSTCISVPTTTLCPRVRPVRYCGLQALVITTRPVYSAALAPEYALGPPLIVERIVARKR